MSNNNGNAPVTQFRELSSIDKGLLGRLTQDRTNPQASRHDRLDFLPLRRVFQRTLRDTTDIRNIFQTMPDLHLPREILVSAICSPGDLTKTSLIFDDTMTGVDSALTATLNRALEQFYVKERKMDTKVAEWIDDALIWSGAHPIMIIPEAAIDKMIAAGSGNVSMESVASYGGEWEYGWFKPKGILGLRLPSGHGEDYYSFESSRNRINTSRMAEYHTIKASPKAEKVVDLPIKVTDNLMAFRTPAVQQLKRARAFEKAYGTSSLESRRRQRQADLAKVQENGKEGLTNSQVYSQYFKRPQAVNKSRLMVVPTLKQSDHEGLGHPLEYHLASESVIPVHVPGDPTNRVGAFVILDSNGFPVSFSNRLNFYDDIRRGAAGPSTGSPEQASSEVLQIGKELMGGNIKDMSNYELDRLSDLYGKIIEADIIARLKSGIMGGDFELGRTDVINRLMLSRSLKNQLTTLLYVPAELMVYMAYEYNENGVGKSILEDAKPLAAMRAAVTVANVIGATKNAIPGKDINIELDPDDGDPVGTATFLANEALGLAYHTFPLNISSTMGIAEQLQLSSFSVNVTGNPRFPEVKTTITPRESHQVQIDKELTDQLRDDLTRVFSLTPEMVDSVNQPEFATTVVKNNLMLLKRVMILQSKTNPMLTDYVRIFTYNSGILIEQLLDLINQNSKLLPTEYKDDPEGFLEEYLNSITVSLPEPETDNLTKQLETMKEFSQSLEEAIGYYIREEFFDGYSPEQIQQALPTVVAAWKGVIMREWMRKRGILRELDIFSSAEDGSPLMDLSEEMATHVTSVMKSVGEYVKKVAKDAAKRRIELDKIMDADEKAKKLAELVNGQEPDDVTPTDETTDEFGGSTPDGESDFNEDHLDVLEDEGTPREESTEETPSTEEETTEEEQSSEEETSDEEGGTSGTEPSEDDMDKL